jgi:chromosome segregation ATPase
MFPNEPEGPLEALRQSLSALRQSIEAWAAIMGQTGAFDREIIKRTWDDLFARTLAVEQLCADVDRGQKAVNRDIDLLVADVGHIEKAWSSALEHLGRLDPNSPTAAALNECLKRQRDLEDAPKAGPLRAQWTAAITRIADSIAEISKVMIPPPSATPEEIAAVERREQKALTGVESLRAELAEAREAALSLEKRLTEELDAARKRADAAEQALGKERIKSERFEKALQEEVAQRRGEDSPLRQQLAQAQARIAKLTEQLEAKFRKA